MTQKGLEALLNQVKSLVNLEVVGYEQGEPVFKKYEGVVKGEVDKEELGMAKKYKPRSKPSQTQISVATEVITEFVKKGLIFKVLFEGRDIVIKLSNGFIKLTGDGAKVAGFSSLDEEPIKSVTHLLKRLGKVTLLKALK